MESFLRIVLPVYFLLYFFVLFVLKSIIVGKRINKNPLVLPRDDSAYGLVGFYFKLTMLILAAYVIFYAAFPDYYLRLVPFPLLNHFGITYTGLALLAVSFIWIMIAQNHMRNSWRIGIDEEEKTELITTGLFRFSRNPIFLGMITSMIGLFLATPNVVTLIVLVCGYMLIQIQIRLEEDYLAKSHGADYSNYSKNVRRLI